MFPGKKDPTIQIIDNSYFLYTPLVCVYLAISVLFRNTKPNIFQNKKSQPYYDS